MAKNVTQGAPLQPPGAVEVTEIRKSVEPAPPPPPSERKGRGNRAPLSEWFSSLDKDERENLWYYYIERMDPNIVITTEAYENTKGGSYLCKLKPTEIEALSNGAFEQELKSLLQSRFGGGRYKFLAVHRKIQNRMRTDFVEVTGDPVLTDREGYRDGRPAMPGAGPNQNSMLPYMLELIRAEVAKVRPAEGNNTAQQMAAMAQAMNEAHSKAFQWALDNQPKAASQADAVQQVEHMFKLAKELMVEQRPVAQMNPMEQFTQFANMMKALRELERPAETAAPSKSLAMEIVDGVTRAVKEAVGTRAAPKAGTSIPEWMGLFAEIAKSPLGMAVAGKISQWNPAARPAGGGGVVVRRGPVIPNGANFPAAAPEAPIISGTAGGQPVGGSIRMPDSMSQAPQPQAAPASPIAKEVKPTHPGYVEVDQNVADAIQIDLAKHAVVRMFEQRASGDEVADMLLSAFPSFADQIAAIPDPSLIQTFLTKDPVLCRIASNPRFPQFVQEFLDYLRAPETEAPDEKEAS